MPSALKTPMYLYTFAGECVTLTSPEFPTPDPGEGK